MGCLYLLLFHVNTSFASQHLLSITQLINSARGRTSDFSPCWRHAVRPTGKVWLSSSTGRRTTVSRRRRSLDRWETSADLRTKCWTPWHYIQELSGTLRQRFSTFVTLWTPQRFQARVPDPTAQAAPASTFRTPGWARTCLIKIAYPNDMNSTKC